MDNVIQIDPGLMQLALAVGRAVRNQCATRGDSSIPILMPDQEYVAEEACEFAEYYLWTK